MRLHFQSYGTGVPLIILHGLLGSLDNWQSISRKLGETRRVCALDLRNHGRSPHNEEFNYEVMADDVLEFMDGQQMERANMLGHSMGGKTAMHFALRHPQRLNKLVIVDIAPKAYAPAHAAIFEALFALALGSFRDRNEMDRALAARIPEAAVRQFLLKNVTRDEHGAFQWKPNLPAIWRNYAGLNAALTMSHTFSGPTLFVRGGKSDYLTQDDGAFISQLFPHAQVATIAEAGHWVHADAPEKFVELVADFVG